MEVLTGQVADISIALEFLFWDKAHITRCRDNTYNGKLGNEEHYKISGRFVGFARNVGHELTFLVLTDDTKRIIARSRVRLAEPRKDMPKIGTGVIPAGVKPTISTESDNNNGRMAVTPVQGDDNEA